MFSFASPWLTSGTSFSSCKRSPVLVSLLDFNLKVIADPAEVTLLLPSLFWFYFDRVFITEQGNLKINPPKGFIFKSSQWLLTRVPVPRYNTLYRRARLRCSHGVHHLPISLRSIHLLMLVWLLPSDLIIHANLQVSH